MLLLSVIVVAVAAILLVVSTICSVRAARIPARPRSAVWLWRGLAVLSLALTAVFAFAFYDRYWLWRDCFNELGRCYDSETQSVYLEQAGMIWGGMTGIALGAAVFFGLLSRKK